MTLLGTFEEPTVASELSSPVDPRPSTHLRILIADDNVDAANTLAIMLRMMKHMVETAYDGHEAVETYALMQPDVVILDIGMPKLNGYEAAKAIRQHATDKVVMLIALTGWGQEEDRRRSRSAGFDHHLVKPADLNFLNQLLVEAASRLKQPGT